MWGAIADAVGGIAGSVLGYFGNQQTNSSNAAIAAQTNDASTANANAANATSLQIANENIAQEQDFAQNGISWRVADAAKNGISPLAALGAAEPSFSPVQAVMQTPNLVSPSYQSPLTAASAGLPQLGQNISRALSTTKDPVQQAMDQADLATKRKTNDLLDLQIQNAQLSLARQGANPGIPNAFTTMMNVDGTVSVVPTRDAASGSHGEFLGPMLWSLDNKLLPAVDPSAGRDDIDSAPFSVQWANQ